MVHDSDAIKGVDINYADSDGFTALIWGGYVKRVTVDANNQNPILSIRIHTRLKRSDWVLFA